MSASMPTAQFDELNAMLQVNSAALAAITEAASVAEACDFAVELTGASGTRDGVAHPTMLGIVEVLSQPTRSVVIERFVNDGVSLLFVVWDSAGRYIITEPAADDQTVATATTIELLPALLRQALRLHGNHEKAATSAISMSAQTLDEVLTGQSTTSSDEPANSHLVAVADQLQHAWRASGSWAGAQTDSTMTVLAAGNEGLWSVEHEEQRVGGTARPDTEVVLTPRSSLHVIDRLGEVVTGRKVAVSGGSA